MRVQRFRWIHMKDIENRITYSYWSHLYAYRIDLIFLSFKIGPNFFRTFFFLISNMTAAGDKSFFLFFRRGPK